MLLGEFRNMPPINMEALEDVLLHISEMVCELPWLQELDLNPLIVDENGAIAADARIVIDHAATSGDRYSHMAIHPYPSHLVQEWEQPNGMVITIRPIRPEDAEMEQEFVKAMSDESRYYRFMDTLRELTQSMLVRFTQIDYDREMAFVAVGQDGAFSQQILGVVRAIASPDQSDAEFAILVRSDLKGLGLGKLMMEKIVRYARERGIGQLSGMTMPSNRGMIDLAKRLGFKIDIQLEDGIVNMELPCADQVV